MISTQDNKTQVGINKTQVEINEVQTGVYKFQI